VTDWLDLCRGTVAEIGAVLERLPSRHEREPVLARGVGGDDTTAIDAAAERALVSRLDALALTRCTLVSEELGERERGGGGPPWIVVDPIDGSVNAKRGIPFFAFSLAVANGPTMGEVEFGYVYDFGSREEWTARRGEGAWLNGEPLGALRPKGSLEILAFEATTTDVIAERAPAMVGLAQRLRVMGSLALSLCHLAAGRLDGVCSLKGARSVDVAAAQLLVRELGLAIELVGGPPFAEAPLDLVGRARVAAAGSAELCARISERLQS
jgi:myo-inositol-1(or 4)-monophosphatase